MFDKFKTIGIGILIALVIAIGVGVYFKVSSTISNLETTITNKQETIDDLVKDKDNLTAKLTMEKANTQILANSLNKIKEEAVVLDNKINQANRELIEWRAKPPEIKYVESVKKIITNNNSKDCAYGLELNKKIANLKYGEL